MKIDTIIEKGKFIRTSSAPESLAYFPENRELIAGLFSKYRMEWVLGRDGLPLNVEMKEWVLKGKRGQIYEFGRNKLGVSVEGTRLVTEFSRATKGVCRFHQNGEGEANFWFEPTQESLKTVLGWIKPTMRRNAKGSGNGINAASGA